MITNNLKKIRIKKELTVSDICEIIGVNKSTYYKWEDGSRVPSLELAKKISDSLNVSMEDIFFNNKIDDTSN